MYNMSPYSLSRSFRDKPCRAVIYGRASTEHEAQVKALQNQMQWYDDVARFHPHGRNLSSKRAAIVSILRRSLANSSIRAT